MILENRNEPYDGREKIEEKRKPLEGKLKNGNPSGNPHNAPRCHAKKRKQDALCQGPAMANGRCRLHGGLSTGPRTAEGLERSRKARWKHGFCSAESKAEQQRMREEFKAVMAYLKQI